MVSNGFSNGFSNGYFYWKSFWKITIRKTIRNHFKKETIRKNNLFEKTIVFFWVRSQHSSSTAVPPAPRSLRCAAWARRWRPPGKAVQNQWERYGFMETYVENHHFKWINPAFLWPLLIAMLVIGYTGWWFGTLLYFSIICGMSSSQLTNSYFSEG